MNSIKLEKMSYLKFKFFFSSDEDGTFWPGVVELPVEKEVTIDEAEKAVETLLTWIGDDPKREGLLETPKRVIKAFSEHFAGYKENPSEILSKTFKEIQGYDDIVILKKIDLRLLEEFQWIHLQ